MYPVSDAFLRAVRSNTRKYFWTGTIVTKGGMTYEFGAKEIVKGSGYISRQCCGSTEIELGMVYAAEMGITLLSDIDRYTLEEAQVTLVFHLVLADGSVEDVPMGGFEVSEANRLAKCLELRKYGKDPVMKVEQRHRFSSSFSDFITRYTAVSSTNKQTQIAEYYALDPGDVLTFAGGQADEGQITCITSIRQKIGIHTFTNASAHEIGQTKVKLITIQFASSEENHMQFFAQVVVDVAADPVERSAEASGTVVIPFPGGSGSGTGSGTVDVGDCIASVSGQAMAAGEAWDGKLEVEAYIRRFAIGGGLDVNGFRESLSMQMKETVNRGFEVYFAERAGISGFCRPVEMEGV